MTFPVITITHKTEDIKDYVISYERNKFICTGIGTLSISVASNYPKTIQEWDTIVLREAGRKKGTYFVVGTSKNAITGLIDADCQDGSLKLTSYFISDIYNINYESYARYWIEKFLTEAGIDYEFSTEEQGALLSENFSLGPASCYDTIQTLLQNSGWYMYFDGDNTCHIGSLTVDLSDVDKVIRTNTVISFLGKKDDKMLRNRAVVWGNYDPVENIWVFADVVQHTPWDRNDADIRTAVVASSSIRGYDIAYALATKLLAELTKLTYTKELDVAGEVNLDLGDVVKLKTKYHNGECLVTSIGSRTSSSGLLTTMTLDQRCPRLFGYVAYLDYVYVGTTGGGVWRKPLDSDAWEAFSTGLANWNVTDLIIKNGIFACVADGYCYINVERTADWKIYIPIGLTDLTGITYPSTSYEAVAVDIDDSSNDILIGYRLKDALGDESYRSWVVEITPDMQLISTRQVFIIDQDHQNFRLIDVDKYAADRLCTAEGPAIYAPSDPNFWGTRKVYKFTDPDPKSITLGPPPVCETYEDPLVDVATHDGGYYEDSTWITEGNSISGFWSSGAITWFTYDYAIEDTPYSIEHPIWWPTIYGGTGGGNPNPQLVSRIVYRKSAEALSEGTALLDRVYHVCDIVRVGAYGAKTTYLVHHQVTPLVEGYSYQIQNVDLATTGNITLFGEQTIDGYTATTGMRVLVKDQLNPVENGIYYVSVGAWTRTIYVAVNETLQNGMFVKVDLGTLNYWAAWQVESDEWNTIEVSDIYFVRVLELVPGVAQVLDNQLDFTPAFPGSGITFTELVPKMRDGIIYYCYNGHIITLTTPPPMFVGTGVHNLYMVRYDILNGVLSSEIFYTYDYALAGGSRSKFVYDTSQLIPAEDGMGIAFFEWVSSPVQEARLDLRIYIFPPVGSIFKNTRLWTVPDIPYGVPDPGEPCGVRLGGGLNLGNAGLVSMNKIVWTGTAISGENSYLTSYAKFKVKVGYGTTDWCCIYEGGLNSYAQYDTLICGNIDFGKLMITTSESTRGATLDSCVNIYYDNLDYAEAGVNYDQIQPLYTKLGTPCYIYGNTFIYDATNVLSSDGLLGMLAHPGYISPQQDDFDNGIYILDTGTSNIYKESPDGLTTFSTLHETAYDWPLMNRLFFSNGYFFLIHTVSAGGFEVTTDRCSILKLKNEYLFPDKNLCYLMQENKSEGITRGLDYGLKDYDFYDLQLENSQDYPLVAWTVGTGLIVYSGCGSGVLSAPQHLKYYSIDLGNTPIAGEFNDARVFMGATGKYIGVADRNGYTFSTIPSNSISEDDFATLVTFSGVSGKLETSNYAYPYVFASTSGVGFYQRDPGAPDFVSYSPGGLFGEINSIRIDDRV